MDVENRRVLLPFALERIEQEELLDLGSGSFQDVVENLTEMQRINDMFGGTRALTRHLFPRLMNTSSPVCILDLGTGGAGLPRHIVSWARARRKEIRILAVDRSARNLSATEDLAALWPEIQLLQADALELPLPDGSVDFVISSLFLHHLCPSEVQTLLRRALGIARRGVLMSDLVRGWLPLAAFGMIRPIFARNHLTHHDGALSIRRAYTPAELREIAVHAGLPALRVHVHFPWRVTLVAEK